MTALQYPYLISATLTKLAATNLYVKIIGQIALTNLFVFIAP